MVCTGLTLPFHYNPLPFHPFTRSVQLDIPEIHTAHTGALIHAHDIPFLGEMLTTLVLADTIICLITTQEGITLQICRPPMVIPPDTHTHSTHSRHMEWGPTPLPSPTTRNHDSLYCYYWNLSPSEVILLTDTIRGRTLSGEKWDLTQPIHKYCPETDTPLWSYTEGTRPSRRHTTTFLGGAGVDEAVILALLVPPFTLQKCYRELNRTSSQGSTQAVETPYNIQLSQSGDLVDHV